MVKTLAAALLASIVGLGSLTAGTKTDTFSEIIGENPQTLMGVTKLKVVGIPGIPELTIDNPRTSPEGKLTDGTGFIRWNKWGALRVEDVEVKDGKLELKVLGMLPTKNFIQKKESADAVEARFTMVIGASGVEQTGFSVTVPEAKLPGGAVTVKDLVVSYNPPEIAMGGVFSIGAGGKGLGGAFSIYDGNFNGLALKGGDLNWKLGASGSKIDKVDVGFFNIQNPPWFIDGGFTVIVGETRVAGKWPLEVEARGRFYSDYRIDIRGNAAIAGIPVGNAYLTYIPSFNVDAGAQVDLLAIIIGSAQIQARAGSLGGSISARVQVPPYVPLIGRWQLGGANAYFLFAPPTGRRRATWAST